jgi:hypothetical protein
MRANSCWSRVRNISSGRPPADGQHPHFQAQPMIEIACAQHAGAIWAIPPR